MENTAPPPGTQRRRMPSQEVSIAEILSNPRVVTRIRITGMVVSSDESRRELMVNDGSGTIRVFSNEIVAPKTLVRIIGRISPLMEGGAEVDAELIQPLNGVDPKLIKEVRDLRYGLQNQYDEDHKSKDLE